MDTDKPINEDRSAILIDIRLFTHVEAVWLSLLLCCLHVLLDFVAVDAHVVDVCQS